MWLVKTLCHLCKSYRYKPIVKKETTRMVILAHIFQQDQHSYVRLHQRLMAASFAHPWFTSPPSFVKFGCAVFAQPNVCHKQINKQTMQKALLHLQLLPWWRNDYASVSKWTPWCEHTFWMSPSRRGGGGTRWSYCFRLLS